MSERTYAARKQGARATTENEPQIRTLAAREPLTLAASFARQDTLTPRKPNAPNPLARKAGNAAAGPKRNAAAPALTHDFSKIRIQGDPLALRSADAPTLACARADASALSAPQERTTAAPPSAERANTLAALSVSSISGKRAARAPRSETSAAPAATSDKNAPPAPTSRVGFMRGSEKVKSGLMIYEQPDEKSQGHPAPFGTRVQVTGEQTGWYRVVGNGQIGYARYEIVHFPPPGLLDKDPGMRLYRIPSGMTGFHLVKEAFHLSPDQMKVGQDMRFYLNAIRSVNKPNAFQVKAGTWDTAINAIFDGRDANNVELLADFDIWLPSLQFAGHADVSSGSIRYATAKFAERQFQRIEDYKEAVARATPLIIPAIGRHIGQDVRSMMEGLKTFARDALIIMGGSTIIGMIVGAIVGEGAGAIPGAAVGFEIGLFLLEAYGLANLVGFVASKLGDIGASLWEFIKLAWKADGDDRKVQQAGAMCADALGNFLAAVLEAAAMYVGAKIGAKVGPKVIKALSETKFGRIVGESQFARWLEERSMNHQERRDAIINKVKEKVTGEGLLTPEEFSEITAEDFAKDAKLQRRVYNTAVDFQRKQYRLARRIINKLNLKGVDVVSILKRPDFEGFVEGVKGKCKRNGYTQIAQMDDMVRGRFDLNGPEDVKRVAAALQEDTGFEVKEVVEPRVDKGNDLVPGSGLTRYPRYHVVLKDMETGLTHEWQVGTKATSELYENKAGTASEIRIPDALKEEAAKSDKHFNPDLHDIEYDLFQSVDKKYPYVGAKYHLREFINDVMKASDESGQGRLDAKNMQSLHQRASALLDEMVKGEGAHWIAQFFH